ncbi:TPA: DUF2635 domain-containing protein [Burkholderia cepacia]|uniref:DUF2635 domain-containing protein n=1 Tax=Burkholderia cepacia TaxID=292 RepID=UPI001CF52462|nr:DUF2635 domain-containing protein [Burkholderia cepacia]MCA8363212.1 DUF2635 domain-containing protein [Burkholderia cepacia]HDV6364647.1 DUF2635 domain-containing protein [Burkholderia cepacia]
MRVKPAQGLKVRDPHTKKLLPDDGIDVPDDSPVWNRILNDGDVVRVKQSATAQLTSARAETEGDKA